MSLDATDAAIVTLVEQDGQAAAVVKFARRFMALLRDCGVAGRRGGRALADPGAKLNAWLADACTCGASAIATFAAGLQTDGAAVRAALTRPWSSGQAEGQINRLKLLKRQSYGHASFDLLQRRVLMAARSIQSAEGPPNRVNPVSLEEPPQSLWRCRGEPAPQCFLPFAGQKCTIKIWDEHQAE